MLAYGSVAIVDIDVFILEAQNGAIVLVSFPSRTRESAKGVSVSYARLPQTSS